MIAVLIAVIVGLAAGTAVSRVARAHYRQRWLAAVKLIDQLTQEAEMHPLETPDPKMLPASPQGAPWTVSARTIKGITTVLLKRDGQVETFDSIAKTTPGYADKLTQLVQGANHIAQSRNRR